MKNKPLVTIIIPTHNEAAHITACLTSLFHQSYPRIEIYLVDDGSTDKTVSIIQNFIRAQKNTPPITLLSQAHQGPGAARNKAAFQAKGELLVFVDADMTFDRRFIDLLTTPIRQGKTVGTFTKQEHVANNKNPWAKSWSLLRGWEDGHMHMANSPDSQPVFRAITSRAFKQSGGFELNRGYDDDWSLSEKLGKYATNAPGAVIYHHNPSTLRDIYTQSKWMAKRRYKFSLLGKIFALIRVSLFFSLITSFIVAKKHKYKPLFKAKLISDLGQTRGLLELLTGNTLR